MVQNYVSAELRQTVRKRAAGSCEYCLMPDGFSFFAHQLDHIIAQKHGGETKLENLAWACMLCNMHKGTDLTSIDFISGQIERLFHPRTDEWNQHFRLLVARIEPLTSIGRVTERLLQLNLPERLDERRALMAAGIMKMK